MKTKKSLIAIFFLLYCLPAFSSLTTPSLTSPAVSSLNNSPDILLDWSAVSNATAYEYKISTNSGLVGATIQTVSGSSQANTSNLHFGTTYYWQVRAVKTSIPIDSSAWSSIWNFTTTDMLTPVSPASGAINQAPDVILDWSPLTGITYYDYQWDTSATFTSPLSHYGSIAGGSSQVNTSNLRFGTKYYWHARARHSSDTTQWTSTWNFTTIDFLTHVSPANNSIGVGLNPTIDWSGITGITGYQYEFSTDINFSNPSLYTTNTTSQANLTNLSYGTEYYWQVRAFHLSDTSSWSVPWSFTTLYQITGAPVLVSPTDNTMDIPLTGTSLVWFTVSGATLYEYQYADNSSFTNHVTNTTTGLNSFTGNLLPNTTYYWKVRAGNGSGFSPWSAIWTFTTEIGTGINDYSENEKYSVFPNPTNGTFTLTIPATTKQINILNAFGQLVDTLSPEGKTTVNLNMGAYGIYFVQVIGEKGMIMKKVIVCK
ncbi:MAG: T9SS type A sorting domain-containing protein [Bacteroidetes bacterium]|nr:T9SS type A sorting domain-containing protein [Bacteroidota bacterium]